MTYSVTDANQSSVFVHVPKSAGTSVRRWYEDIYGDSVDYHRMHTPIKDLDFSPEYKFKTNQIYWLTDNGYPGNVKVDSIIKVENVQKDFATIQEQLGYFNPLPHENTKYQNVNVEMTLSSRKIIEHVFKHDFDFLGY